MGALIVRGGVAYGRLHGALSSRLERLRGACGAFLREALSDRERAELALRLFARLDAYGPPGLMAWEEPWYGRELPPPPARVLVGGCGAGRELGALHARGYSVFGFEPAARLAEAARRILADDERVWTLSYQELLHDPGYAQVEKHAPYDAVIFGWGSFAHVLERETRQRVLQTTDSLAPRGPLLLSFPFLSDEHIGQTPGWRVYGERLGRQVRRWRKLPEGATEPEEFLPHAGFVHCFSELELAALAGELGRTLRWGERRDVYPHCSLLTPPAPRTE